MTLAICLQFCARKLLKGKNVVESSRVKLSKVTELVLENKLDAAKNYRWD